MKRTIPFLAMILLLTLNIQLERKSEKVTLEINGQILNVVLYNNETANKLKEMLPLVVTMNDLNNNEKYYYFQEAFPIKEERVSEIKKGDIMLYQKNCLVIFYEDFYTNYSYTKVGKIENSENLKEVLNGQKVTIKIERS